MKKVLLIIIPFLFFWINISHWYSLLEYYWMYELTKDLNKDWCDDYFWCSKKKESVESPVSKIEQKQVESSYKETTKNKVDTTKKDIKPKEVLPKKENSTPISKEVWILFILIWIYLLIFYLNKSEPPID
jgi:hypothetical protein